MNRQIRRLGLGLVGLFALLFGQIAYVQVFAADRISGDPANATRQIIAEYRVQRGAILAADGTALALSRRAKGQAIYKFVRQYPQGSLFGQITGYYSRVYGRSSLEQSANPYLSGSDPSLAVSTLSDMILGRPRVGGSIQTTVHPALQQVAEQALGAQQGAVVALDPTTGDILAMWSNPSYDPFGVSAPTAAAEAQAWKQLTSDPAQPLLSRANAQLYPPGSTFKIITAAAALEAGMGPASVWPNPRSLPLPGSTATIQNFGGEYCAGGAKTVTLLEAFTESCNVIFGEVGLKVGAERMSAQALKFGFCPTNPPAQISCISPTIPYGLPFGLPSESGRFPEASYFGARTSALAISAIGQDNDLANPLQMALVAGAVANHGQMMQPRLVTEVHDAQGRVVQRFAPAVYDQAISPGSADELTAMMVNVVQHGTGQAAQIPGIAVAGKTGTAQHATGAAPHAWFTAFASSGGRAIAVAVIVLDGGSLGSEATGGQVAAPIARQVMQAYLEGNA